MGHRIPSSRVQVKAPRAPEETREPWLQDLRTCGTSAESSALRLHRGKAFPFLSWHCAFHVAQDELEEEDTSFQHFEFSSVPLLYTMVMIFLMLQNNRPSSAAIGLEMQSALCTTCLAVFRLFLPCCCRCPLPPSLPSSPPPPPLLPSLLPPCISTRQRLPQLIAVGRLVFCAGAERCLSQEPEESGGSSTRGWCGIAAKAHGFQRLRRLSWCPRRERLVGHLQGSSGS